MVPDLYSVVITVDGENVDRNRLGIASVIMGAVGLAIKGTSLIVGGVRAKREREEFMRQSNNLNQIRSFATEMVNAYNEDLWRMLDVYETRQASLSGLRASLPYDGLINDGVGEMEYRFPGGFKAALRAYNDETERLKAEWAEIGSISPAESANRRKREEFRFKNLADRFSWYGLKPVISVEGNAYLVAINDNLSEWNNQRIENWFTVDKDGELHKRSSTKSRRSERNDENDKWEMRRRVRDEWEERVNWFQESGLMSWILYAYLTGEDSSNAGRVRAQEDYGLVFQEAEKLAQQLSRTVAQERIEAGENPEIAVASSQYVVTAPRPSIWSKAKTWWNKKTNFEKMALGGSSVFALGMILRRN